MAEHSDIYLLLYRQTGTYKQIEANKMTAALVLATLTKGMIIGDSLDAPFVGFIKVEGIEHGIGLKSDQKELEWGDSHQVGSAVTGKDDYLRASQERLNVGLARYVGQTGAAARQARSLMRRAQRRHAAQIDHVYHKMVEEQRNAFINTHLPKHGELEFTKMIDRATPQLAFGCSAQERFPCALFFLRKKVGFGVGGIRIPHLVIGLRKVRISDWKMKEGERESISLRYADIAWAALGQIADSDVPMPIPTARMFSVEEGAGGETFSSGWAYGVQAIGAIISAIAGGAVKGISAGLGDGSYQS